MLVLYCTCYSMETAASCLLRCVYMVKFPLQIRFKLYIRTYFMRKFNLSNSIPIFEDPTKRVWSSWWDKVLREFEGNIWPCISILTFEERDMLTYTTLCIWAIHHKWMPYTVIPVKVQIKHCIYTKIQNNNNVFLITVPLCCANLRAQSIFQTWNAWTPYAYCSKCLILTH